VVGRHVHRLDQAGLLPTEALGHSYNTVIHGGFVILGSDTGVALAVAAHDARAVRALRLALGMPDARLSVAFASFNELEHYALLSPVARQVAASLTPGPLTLCASMSNEAKASLGTRLSGDETIGARYTQSLIELQLTAATRFPLTTTAIRDDRGDIVRDSGEAREIVEAGLERAADEIGRTVLLSTVEAARPLHREQSTVVGFDAEDRPQELRPGAMPFSRVLEASRHYTVWSYSDHT
jgi:tRNA A37 threonylcarbamoyladenosine synthetase subunit TsaC/SUA5/YrdC